MNSVNLHESMINANHEPKKSRERSSTGSYSAICCWCGIVSIVASIAVVVWMFVGGLVTYMPRLTANEMQNIYLSRMFWYGVISVNLQLLALGMFVAASRLGESVGHTMPDSFE